MIEKGKSAPDFALKNAADKDISLKDFKGKKLIIYFYPKDNTPGCTVEAKDFTCLVPEFKKKNCMVVGISKDSTKTHRNFIEKHEVGIELLSDPEHEVIEKYGAWREKKNYGRTYMGIVRSTYLIDENGIVENVWDNVRAKGHAQKVLDSLT